MSLLKTLGVILIVLSCSAAGFLKSYSVLARGKKLSLFCEGLDLLLEYIEQSKCELGFALKTAFLKCDFLSFDNTYVKCCDSDLNVEDKALINDFFSSLGSSAKKIECDRIKSLKNIMINRAQQAIKETPQKCKLWQTFGVCTGLTIGILLV